MPAKDANTDCLNYLNSVLMVIVQRRIQCTGFVGCHWHGCPCQSFRDVITTNEDTLAARYEQTMARLEQITRAGYLDKVKWECDLTMVV